VTDPELRQLYARGIAGSTAAGRAGCVAPEVLLAIVEGHADEAQRIQALRHVAACGACQADLDLLRSAASAARGLKRRYVPTLTIAASLVVLASAAVLWRARIGSELPRSEPLRGGGNGVLLIGPNGDVVTARPVLLTWRSLPLAVRYEVEVLDARGRVLFSAATRDTATLVPDQAGLTPGADYYWWVHALLADGTAPRSGAQRFRIRRP
jgi:hypothetical protein